MLYYYRPISSEKPRFSQPQQIQVRNEIQDYSLIEPNFY